MKIIESNLFFMKRGEYKGGKEEPIEKSIFDSECSCLCSSMVRRDFSLAN